MKEYELIAFDLDGTLTDPSRGLIAGFEYAFRKLGIDYGVRDKISRFIGPPLLDAWQSEFGFTAEEANRAVLLFREYYNIYGWWDNSIYPGIEDMLKTLRENGRKIVLATSKPEDTAKKVLRHFGIDKYFDFIGGAATHKERDKKHEVLAYSLKSVGWTDKDGAILVGDRIFDAEGAALVGIDSMGILWGHGSPEEIYSAGFTHVARNTEEVTRLLIG